MLLSVLLALAVGTEANQATVRLEANVPLHDPATSMWTRQERAATADEVTLTVALKVEDTARTQLEAVFWAVSTPGHADYGKHLTNAQARVGAPCPSSLPVWSFNAPHSPCRSQSSSP